jgi:DNA modification methylase
VELITLRVGDALHLPLDDESVDAIVCDPPYELGFMGRDWDASGVAYDPATWAEALRVAKPGAFLVAFGAPRTFPEMAVAVRLAGWERRDTLSWLFGSGFPKSLDVSKALDREAGAEREVVGQEKNWGTSRLDDGKVGYGDYNGAWNVTAPATDIARQWEGWGTALKPAWEPIVLARKPLRGTVAQNVAAFGTGALNIDGSRIATDDNLNGGTYSQGGKSGPMPGDERTGAALGMFAPGARPSRDYVQPSGRWPANVVLDEAAAALLDASVGERTSGKMLPTHTEAARNTYGQNAAGGYVTMETYGDSGGPSRFFYTAKASRSEREAGLDDLEPVRRSDGRETDIENPRLRTSARRNDHPTVKPLDLMRWLVTLVTPPGGVVLDQFMGSGSTGVAAVELGFSFIGIDRDPHYVEIARRRIGHERPMRMALGDA